MIEGYQELDPSKTYLITGGAGFIGFFLSKKLLDQGCRVVGIDNMNDYYDVSLKDSRLKQLASYDRYTFIKGDISDKDTVTNVFEEYKPDIIMNLAAQAGVPYQSLINLYLRDCASSHRELKLDWDSSLHITKR